MTTRPANPNCSVCSGTGIDAVFNAKCTECWVDADRQATIKARYQGVSTSPADRFYTPGERLDGRTFGRSNLSSGARPTQTYTPPVPAPPAPAGAVTPTTALQPGEWPATQRQLNYIARLVSDRDPANEVVARAKDAIDNHRFRTSGSASRCIKALLDIEPHDPTTKPPCGIDLSSLPEVLDKNGKKSITYFGVPGMDTRLKVLIERPKVGKWAGYIFVKDGAEYGQGRRYGMQKPGGTYTGDITRELFCIVIDPAAALERYAALTNRCGVCNRTLEQETSVARGIGPVCFEKLGW